MTPFLAALMAEQPRIRRVALSLTHNHSDADDLVQDTIEQAIGAQHRFEMGTDMGAWVSRICRNRFLSDRRLRRNLREHISSDDADTFGLLTTHGSQEATVLLHEVGRAIGALSPRRRRMLSAVVNGESYKEGAAAEGVTVGTFKSGSSRVRTRLREAFA